ncbi:hypothetical protein C8Q72DRAFT_887478 [Fomitopsis betulina]|nr:hypothetical protein C8Q72DRAFT_887478 [Fomitopsis betulina]
MLGHLYSTSVYALRQSAPRKYLQARNTITMLIKALVQLRSKPIVHAGTKLDNPLLDNSLYHSDGSFELDGGSYPEFKPQSIPSPHSGETSAFEADKMLVYLADFGQGIMPTQLLSAPANNPPLAALDALRAPETILQSDCGPGIDIWAVGCLQTLELLVGPLALRSGPDWSLEDDHLAKMMELTGQDFPPSMLECAHCRSLESAMASYKIPGLSADEIKGS